MALRAVPDHPKFAHLKSLLKMPKAVVLGYLECMWHFTGRYTPQGNIGKYSDLAIESWLEWDGEEGKLIDLFIKSGWLDIDDTYRLIVHDWHQHADKAARQALKRAHLNFLLPDGTEIPPFSQRENTVDTPGHNHGTPWGLPVPVPVPVPEPVINTPRTRVREEASVEDECEIAPGLAKLQYATWLLEQLGLPDVFATKMSASAAIGTLERRRKVPDHIATMTLRDFGLAAQARGEPVNKFWFEDPNKWEPRGNGGSNGAAKTNRAQTIQRTDQRLREMLAKRGICGVGDDDGGNGSRLSERPERVGGDANARDGDAGGDVWHGSGPPGVNGDVRRAGPDILPATRGSANQAGGNYGG